MSAQYKSEYSKPTVASSKCAYASLGCYYGPNSTMPALRPGTTSGAMVVPTYGAIGYNALTHGVAPGCGTYFNITDAYGADASSCSTSYATRLCGGCDTVGSEKGWVCDAKNGNCTMSGQKGVRGVFNSAFECQEYCHRV